MLFLALLLLLSLALAILFQEPKQPGTILQTNVRHSSPNLNPPTHTDLCVDSPRTSSVPEPDEDESDLIHDSEDIEDDEEDDDDEEDVDDDDEEDVDDDDEEDNDDDEDGAAVAGAAAAETEAKAGAEAADEVEELEPMGTVAPALA